MGLADLADFSLLPFYFLFIYNLNSGTPADGTSPSSAGGNFFETFTSMSFRHFPFLPANSRLAFWLCVAPCAYRVRSSFRRPSDLRALIRPD